MEELDKITKLIRLGNLYWVNVIGACFNLLYYKKRFFYTSTLILFFVMQK